MTWRKLGRTNVCVKRKTAPKAAAEDELSAEELCAAEEDARIALLRSKATLEAAKPEDKEVAAAERDKAQRAFDRAQRLRTAAGLKEFCAP